MSEPLFSDKKDLRALTSDRRQQRKFGLVMAVAFGVLGLIRWWLKGAPPLWLFGIGVAFLVFGLFLPKALQPVFVVWLRFAEALNWVVTRALLTVAYYGLITPAGFIHRLVAADPLKRAWDSTTNSYWEEPDDQPEGIERYRDQF